MKFRKPSRIGLITTLVAVAALAVPAVTLTAMATPRPGPGSLIGLLPPEVRETLEALQAFREALIDTAGPNRAQAQAHVDAIRNDAITHFVTVGSILTPSQKTEILRSLSEFRRMPPSERRQVTQQFFAGVDGAALRTAIHAVKDATPEGRPSAVEAALQIVIDGVSPVIRERFGITPVQKLALDRARQIFWDTSRPDRVALSVLVAQNRQTAFASLTPEQQQTLEDAKVRLDARIQALLAWLQNR